MGFRLFGDGFFRGRFGGFSPEAQAAFANYDTYGDGLTLAEKDAMAAYIDAEVSAGHHTKKDHEFIFGLSGNNSLVDYIGGVVATAVNAPIHTIDGYTFNGSTQYLNTGINLSTRTNFVVGDVMHSAYIKSQSSGISFGTVTNNVTDGNWHSLTASATNAYVMRTALTYASNDTPGYHVLRRITPGSTSELLVDGVVKDSAVLTGPAVANLDSFVGCRNLNGSANLFSDAIISTYLIGGQDGVDQTVHNRNLQILLAQLSMLNNYATLGTALVGDERTAMLDYVSAEVTSGNHALKDYELIMGLSGTNSLVDYIGGKVATAVNAPTQSVSGYAFNGTTQYLNSNYNPTSHGVKHTQNDAFAGSFIKTFVSGATTRFYGALDRTAGNYRTTLLQEAGVRWRLGGPNDTGLFNVTFDETTNVLMVGSRTSSTVKDLYQNGISLSQATATSTPLPNLNLYVGGYNDNGTATGFTNCTISSFVIGGGVGFSQTDYNTNLRALLTSLGTI